MMLSNAPGPIYRVSAVDPLLWPFVFIDGKTLAMCRMVACRGRLPCLVHDPLVASWSIQGM